MLENIEISSTGKYKIEPSFKKYVKKRIGKLDKFLPSKTRKSASAKLVVKEVNRPHGNKYELSAALDIPGGKIISARDEASNIFAGVDILEAKLHAQIRRFKLEQTPHQQQPKKPLLHRIFPKRQK